MGYLSTILDWVGKFLIPTLLAAGVLGLVSLIYRKKIIAWVINKYYYYTNKTMIASVKSVKTYPIPDPGTIDIAFSGDFCDQISSNMENSVTNPDWGENSATFDVEGITTSVRVRFEPQMNPSVHNPGPGLMTQGENISGYKLVVETDDKLYFGYKEMQPILQFKTFADKVQEVIEAEYLPRETPDTTHIQVQLLEGIPEGLEDIDDDQLNIQGRVRGDGLDLTFRTPENLQQGLRKYFQATN